LRCCWDSVIEEGFAAGSFGGWFGDLVYFASGEVCGFLEGGNEDMGSSGHFDELRGGIGGGSGGIESS